MLVELETSRGRNEVELEGVALGPKGRFAMQRTLTRVRPREGATKCGAGGSRTLVQTGKPYAFYTLILDFIFVLQQDPSHQLQPYPLNLHHAIEA